MISLSEAQNDLDRAAAKYRRTYDRLYLRSMRAGSAAESERIDRQLALANMEYDAAKAAFAGIKAFNERVGA